MVGENGDRFPTYIVWITKNTLVLYLNFKNIGS